MILTVFVLGFRPFPVDQQRVLHQSLHFQGSKSRARHPSSYTHVLLFLNKIEVRSMHIFSLFASWNKPQCIQHNLIKSSIKYFVIFDVNMNFEPKCSFLNFKNRQKQLLSIQYLYSASSSHGEIGFPSCLLFCWESSIFVFMPWNQFILQPKLSLIHTLTILIFEYMLRMIFKIVNMFEWKRAHRPWVTASIRK